MRLLTQRLLIGLALGSWCFLASSSMGQEAGPFLGGEGPDANGSIDVLARGPIHEAYAQPVVQAGVDVMTVPSAPPEPIPEVPPDIRPEGDHVEWIPGYWAWSDDRQDFLWVSGVWRVIPPGQRWVAGYWSEDNGGYRWVPGFWTSEQNEEVTYYPEPPQSLEQGPMIQQPSENHFWVPGNWVWQDRYVWRPGFWQKVHPNWIWVPARYFWCPSGWIFVDGYWDYLFANRGLMFAPVYFHRPIWRTPGYYYRPVNVVDVTLLTVQLFARPGYYHYYFGDYYAPTYVRHGIVPWYAVKENRFYGYDPLYTYYRWQHRHSPRWEENVRGWYRYYRDNERYRPPRTFAEQRRVWEEARDRVDIQNIVTVKPVQEVRQRTNLPIRLTQVREDQLQELRERTQRVRQFQQERRRLETGLVARERPGELALQGKPGEGPGKPPRTVERPERMRLPRGDGARVATRPDRPQDVRGPGERRVDRRPPGEVSGVGKPAPPAKPDVKAPGRAEDRTRPRRPDVKPGWDRGRGDEDLRGGRPGKPSGKPGPDRPDGRPSGAGRQDRPSPQNLQGGAPARPVPDGRPSGAGRPDGPPARNLQGGPREAKRVPLDGAKPGARGEGRPAFGAPDRQGKGRPETGRADVNRFEKGRLERPGPRAPGGPEAGNRQVDRADRPGPQAKSDRTRSDLPRRPRPEARPDGSRGRGGPPVDARSKTAPRPEPKSQARPTPARRPEPQQAQRENRAERPEPRREARSDRPKGQQRSKERD